MSKIIEFPSKELRASNQMRDELIAGLKIRNPAAKQEVIDRVVEIFNEYGGLPSLSFSVNIPAGAESILQEIEAAMAEQYQTVVGSLQEELMLKLCLAEAKLILAKYEKDN